MLPDGVYTPLHTLQLLWELGSEGQVRDICNQLAARSLLIITNAAGEPTRMVRMVLMNRTREVLDAMMGDGRGKNG